MKRKRKVSIQLSKLAKEAKGWMREEGEYAKKKAEALERIGQVRKADRYRQRAAEFGVKNPDLYSQGLIAGKSWAAKFIKDDPRRANQLLDAPARMPGMITAFDDVALESARALCPRTLKPFTPFQVDTWTQGFVDGAAEVSVRPGERNPREQGLYRMTLRSVGNPDYGQFAPLSPPQRVMGRSLKEMQEKAFAYQEKWNLGSGNWVDPLVYDSAGKVVARISFNGRLWKPGGKEILVNKQNPQTRSNPPAYFTIDSGTNRILAITSVGRAGGAMEMDRCFRIAIATAKREAAETGRPFYVVVHPYIPKGFKVGTEVTPLFYWYGAQVVDPSGKVGPLNNPRSNPPLTLAGFAGSVVEGLAFGIGAGLTERYIISTKKNPHRGARMFSVGDRVKFSGKFLHDTGQHTGPVPFARGVVTGITPVGADRQLVQIKWDDGSKSGALNANLLLESEPDYTLHNPAGKSRAKYVRQQLRHPREFDPRSFRTVTPKPGVRVIVGCPTGQYKRGRCQVGTRAQSVLRRIRPSQLRRVAANPLTSREKEQLLLDSRGYHRLANQEGVPPETRSYLEGQKDAYRDIAGNYGPGGWSSTHLRNPSMNAWDILEKDPKSVTKREAQALVDFMRTLDPWDEETRGSVLQHLSDRYTALTGDLNIERDPYYSAALKLYGSRGNPVRKNPLLQTFLLNPQPKCNANPASCARIARSNPKCSGCARNPLATRKCNANPSSCARIAKKNPKCYSCANNPLTRNNPEIDVPEDLEAVLLEILKLPHSILWSAEPYARALLRGDTGYDDPKSVLLYLKSNLAKWRGADARAAKAIIDRYIKSGLAGVTPGPVPRFKGPRPTQRQRTRPTPRRPMMGRPMRDVNTMAEELERRLRRRQTGIEVDQLVEEIFQWIERGWDEPDWEAFPLAKSYYETRIVGAKRAGLIVNPQMMLLRKADRKALPPLGAQEKLGEEAIAYVKFFTPWTSWTWYATEFDGNDTFFGLVQGHEEEWGYFSLSELKAIRGRWGLRIERDRFFKPTKVSQLRKMRVNPLVKGKDLTPSQRRSVLDSYIYRWTSDNIHRERAWAGIKDRPRVPLQTDEEWLRDHAFWVTKGGRLSRKRHHAEPAYMADDPEYAQRHNPGFTIGRGPTERRISRRTAEKLTGTRIPRNPREIPPEVEKAVRAAEQVAFQFLHVWDVKGNVVTLDPRPTDPVAEQNAEDEMEAHGFRVKWSDEASSFWNNPLTWREIHSINDRALRLRDREALAKRRGKVADSNFFGGQATEAQMIARVYGSNLKKRRRNPLTGKEARELRRDAWSQTRLVHTTPSIYKHPFRKGYGSGVAAGLRTAVDRYGPRGDRRDRSVRVVRKNPPGESGVINVPFKEGQKITIAEARAWVESTGDRELLRQFQEAEKLQKKANRPATHLIWRTIPIGSKSELDMVTAVAHYGDSPETMYRPPKGSKKGRHMYRHEWGEGSGKDKPVPVLAAAGGGAMIVPVGKGQSVGDWMRG